MNRPRVFIDESDGEKLREAGFPQASVWRWMNGKSSPSRRHLSRICQVLGRDVRQTAPVKPLQTVSVVAAPSVFPRQHITINACADDEVCVAVRGAAMRYTANTTLDQRKPIPCASCKRGADRARVEADKKKSDGKTVCHCGELKSPASKECRECAMERKKANG